MQGHVYIHIFQCFEAIYIKNLYMKPNIYDILNTVPLILFDADLYNFNIKTFLFDYMHLGDDFLTLINFNLLN